MVAIDSPWPQPTGEQTHLVTPHARLRSHGHHAPKEGLRPRGIEPEANLLGLQTAVEGRDEVGFVAEYGVGWLNMGRTYDALLLPCAAGEEKRRVLT
jgi:hypothetical protein